MKSISLQHVHFIPKQLEEGILYFSPEFETAVHLCPCGCGNKIVTPLGPVDWYLEEKHGKPSLFPSIGNWQIPCRSHYWIANGFIDWAPQWTEKEIITGRKKEQRTREKYYKKKNKRVKRFKSLLKWLFNSKGHDL